MAVPHTVRRGDSLWGLACQYLGNGNRWPEILDTHNKEVARRGASGLLFSIENGNLIFVGQQILVPAPTKPAVQGTGIRTAPVINPVPGVGIIPLPINTTVPAKAAGTGSKAEGSQSAIPIDLNVTYTIGRDTPPCLYVENYGTFTIKTELSGAITIEIASKDRYRHGLELFMSRNNPVQVKQKLHDAYDPAIKVLTAKPVMTYESGRVKIDAPIGAKANLGPYEFSVQAVTPFQMSGSIKPPTIRGTLEANQRKYTFSADIEFKVDVVWHQKPNGAPEPVTETVQQKLRQTEKRDPFESTGHTTTKWDKSVAEKGLIVTAMIVFATAAASVLYRFATRGGLQPAQIMPPFPHTINREDLRA